jgi:hypothetical protein
MSKRVIALIAVVCVVFVALAIAFLITWHTTVPTDAHQTGALARAVPSATSTIAASATAYAVSTVRVNASSAFPTIVPPSVETITVYPDARVVSLEKKYPDDLADAYFIVDTEERNIANFYADILEQAGWMLDWAHTYDASENGYTLDVAYSYTWNDLENKLPWTPTFLIEIQHLAVNIPRYSVEIQLYRIPNISQIPYYPDATSIQENWQSSVDEPRFDEEHISYLTTATPTELTSFYSSILNESTWSGPDDTSYQDDALVDITKGIIFGWGKGGVENLSYVRLRITATPTSDGMTQVNITKSGTIYR